MSPLGRQVAALLFCAPDPVPIARGSEVELVPEAVPTTQGRIGIGYPDLLTILRPGKEYRSRTVFAFGVER